MLIDAHINLTSDGKWFETGHDASLETALRRMDEAGIEMAGVIVPPGAEQRAFAGELAAKHGDRFFVGFTLGSTDDAELAELVEWLDAGRARFAKIHPRWSGIAPGDPALAPLLAELERRRAPAVFCTYMRGLPVPLERLTPLVFDGIARAYPRLPIVLGHAGTYRPLDALAVGQTHENVYMDVSHVLHYFRGSSLIDDFRFAIDRLDRRMIYGSDYPEVSMDGYLETARDLTRDLADFNAGGFFGGTAEALYLGG